MILRLTVSRRSNSSAVEEDVRSARRCCLIIYSRRPRCDTTNSWDPKLISGYDLPRRSVLQRGRSSAPDETDFSVNGSVIARLVPAKRPSGVAKRFATFRRSRQKYIIDNDRWNCLRCGSSKTANQAAILRRDVKLLSKIRRRRRRQRDGRRK